MISTEKPGTPEELLHYGVKGMKWGVIRKRDKALFKKAGEVNSQKKTAKREAKAQKYVQKSIDLDVRIKDLKAGEKTLLTNRKISKLESKKSQADKDAEAKRQGKLSRRQKQVAVGAAVVGTLVVAGTVYYGLNSGRARELSIRGQRALFGKDFRFKENLELSRTDLNPVQLSNLSKGINPGYPAKHGSTNNCRRCTFAYEMRRRGYEVAATRSQTGSGQTAVGLYNVLDTKGKNYGAPSLAKKVIKTGGDDPTSNMIRRIIGNQGGLERIHYQGVRSPLFKDPSVSPKDIFEVLSRQPERSRGELTATWAGGGAHSMAYEIIRGKAHIFDTQSGRLIGSPETFAASLPSLKGAGFTRLDDMPLDESFLTRWLK